MSYDTAKGIAQSLASLEDFLSLVEARRSAAYDRRESLSDFGVMGRYWLDSCGNFWLLEKTRTAGDEPTVIAGRPLGAASLAGVMPRAVDACQVCGQPWRIDNLEDCTVLHNSSLVRLTESVGQTVGELRAEAARRTDARCFIGALRKPGGVWRDKVDDNHVVEPGEEAVRDTWRFYHRPCRVQELSVQQEAAFREMFRAAGYGDVVMAAVTNRYGSAIYRGPWFEGEVPGGVILIGWRKRVINIDWSSTGKDLTDRFVDVESTKGRYHVHAWTDEQAVDYLRRIRDALV